MKKQPIENATSIVQAIALHGTSQPNKLALADHTTSLTYLQLWHQIIALSEKLKEFGVSNGTCVIVECNQSAAYMVCEFAIQLLGGVFVPIEKNAAKKRILDIARDTEATVHIGKDPLPPAEDLADLIKPLSFFSIDDVLDKSALKDPSSCILHPAAISFPKAEDISEILFSTGTTGKSKGIVLTHGNDIALAENVLYGVEMKADNVELVPMPLSHSHGLRRTYANLVNGSTVVFTDGVTLLKKVFNLMDQYQVTAMDLSPSMLSIIFKLSKDRLGDYAHILDYIQLGSAPLAEEDKLHLSRILPKTRLYNFYGSTEAGCSCLLDFNSMSGKPGCIGKPAKNAHFIVVDENRREISSSREHPGFLASSGPINMKCYFQAPELTKDAMSNGFIYTKDLGYIDEEGYVYMLGRKDDVINYGGIKISPEEIESIVLQHSEILDCACIPVEDPLTGQAPKLFIVPKDPSAHDAATFKKFLASHLDGGKQPKYVEIIDQIPRTFNGKIKRKVLTELNEKKTEKKNS